jgi:predicted ATPase
MVGPMLKSIRFVNWKSFRDATLHIDPLTVLIGANASGKSNAIEGLQFLSRLAQGIPVETALAGSDKVPGLRGGTDWAGFRGADQIQFEEVKEYEDIVEELIEKTVVQLKPNIALIHSEVMNASGKVVYDRSIDRKRLYNLTMLRESKRLNDELRDRLNNLDRAWTPLYPLWLLFVLALEPDRMRVPSGQADQLVPDGRNVAGVIAALPDDQRTAVLEALSSHLSKFPEFPVKRIFIESYGLHKRDAMLCCDEPWGYPIDARCMSDGTLRFVAILTAILTLPKGSLLVIEDVDMGIHPSRAGLILEVLRTEGKRRGVDVLVTTHNVAFLDALPPEMAPFVTVAYRDAETGESHLKPLDELGEYGRILAAGSIGRAVARGVVEHAVRAEPPIKSEPSPVNASGSDAH